MTNKEAIKIATGLRTDFKCESDTMVDFCDTVIEALEQTRWIPVSERLPELDVNVNVYTKKNPIMVSKPVYISYKLDGRDYVCPIPCILHSNGYWYIDNGSLEDWVNLDDYDSGTDSPLSRLEVTAWMPLIEAYQGD